MRLAVLLSGGGRTLQNLIDLRAAGELPLELALVISSCPDAHGLVRARRAGIPTRVVRRGDFPGTAAFTAAVFAEVRAAGADAVALAGWLKLLRPIPAAYQGRVLNIHPSLIPAFCGKGFYGRRVHEAVLEAGAAVTGCTVHLVDDEYDHGPIVLQREVPVEPGDDAEALSDRVFAVERELYPEALRLLAAGRLEVEGRRVLIREG
ncbi:MAG: phosphoribosylglycinamide formyltransferase [Planctomycetota bacterium]